ncbi:MAG: NUDIX hydrolase [Clostridiales bacterium]|nr:MAG: NUDIX hydrolase [Clostridiales bacterium]
MKIKKVIPSTLKYLHSFKIHYLDKNGNDKVWEMVSRGNLDRVEKEMSGETISDGTMIVAFNKAKDKLLMIKEFRPIANKYIYSFPAGLKDDGESIEETASREFKEETGLDFTYLGYDDARYTSVGLTNERVNTIYGYYSGNISSDYLEEAEDITAFFVDRDEAIKILETKEVSLRASFIIRHFFNLPLFKS